MSYAAANSSVFRCALKVVMVAECSVTGDSSRQLVPWYWMLWIGSWSLSPADRVVVDWSISQYELVDGNEACHVDKQCWPVQSRSAFHGHTLAEHGIVLSSFWDQFAIFLIPNFCLILQIYRLTPRLSYLSSDHNVYLLQKFVMHGSSFFSWVYYGSARMRAQANKHELAHFNLNCAL